MRASLCLSLAILAFALGGCASTDPNRFPIDPKSAAHLKVPQTVALVNGYAEEPNARGVRGARPKPLTETAVTMLKQALEKQGYTVSSQAPKTITLRVTPTGITTAAFRYTGRIQLVAKFGDGTEANIPQENLSPMGLVEAFDGAALFALNDLLEHETFVAYMNSAPKIAAIALAVPTAPAAPEGLAAADSPTPQVGATWTYRLSQPRRVDGPTQRNFVAKVMEASASGIIEQVTIGGAAPAEAVHSAERSLLPLQKSLFSPYLLVFETDLHTFRDLGRPKIEDPTCSSILICDVSARVIGNEQVTVPAGSFDAVRVEVQQRWRTSTVSRSHAGQEPSGRTLTIWYARETKRAVKYQSRPAQGTLQSADNNFELELVSYKLQ